jgi:hypothetical protein
VLRREEHDAAIVTRHLRHSNRIDVSIVRPPDLVRTPLRWPDDPRIVPRALCVLFRDRASTVAAAERLVRHVGEVPVIGVLDVPYPEAQTADMAADLVGAGVEDVVDIDHLTPLVLEQIVVAAIDRRVNGVLHLGDALPLTGGLRSVTG